MFSKLHGSQLGLLSLIAKAGHALSCVLSIRPCALQASCLAIAEVRVGSEGLVEIIKSFFGTSGSGALGGMSRAGVFVV